MPLWGLTVPNPYGRSAGHTLRQELMCSLEAEFLLSWEASMFARKAFN